MSGRPHPEEQIKNVYVCGGGRRIAFSWISMCYFYIGRNIYQIAFCGFKSNLKNLSL